MLSNLDRILSDYLKIHNSIFKFNLRKLIPIPFIFKRIDYLKHANQCEALIKELTEIRIIYRSRSEDGSDFYKLIDDYIIKLESTIIILHEICKKFNDNTWSYTYNYYKKDIQRYEATRTQYVALGRELNKYIKDLS